MIEGLRQHLERAWCRSDQLFGLLRPEALFERPISLRHPFIFYLGHLPAFAWNQACRGALKMPPFNAEFDKLFEFGIDPLDEPNSGRAWPEPSKILGYRDRVRDELRGSVERPQHSTQDALTEHVRILHVVLEHELMHHETLLYMAAQLPLSMKLRPVGSTQMQFEGAATPALQTIRCGTTVVGARFADVQFGWDNEFEAHEVWVPAFCADRTAVRNSEFLEFVRDGGYEQSRWWRPEDWRWRARSGLRYPVSWVGASSELRLRTLFDEVPLDRAADWPVYVSWAEAAAFAQWRGMRLPTEPELIRAGYGSPDGHLRAYPWGDEDPDRSRGSFDFGDWAPVPVGSRSGGASAWGLLDVLGGGWEWTSTVFAPLPGFSPYIRTYPGYSANFFDGEHFVLHGASFATDAKLLRRSFRNWFQPRYPYVFAKFRCVQAL